MNGRGSAAGGAAPSVFEAHPRLTLSLILLAALVLLDLGAAALLDRLRKEPPKSGLRIADPVVHHGLRPSFSTRERWGPWEATYHTNSLALRDAAVREVPLRSDRRRVLFIGDSFTEGIGVEWPETFVGRLSTVLAPQGVEVLNAGAASYCPIIYERRVRQLLDAGLRLDEVVVYVDVGDVLDEVVYKHDGDGNVRGRESRRIQEQRANQAYEVNLPALMPLRKTLDEHTVLIGAVLRGLMKIGAHPYQRGAAWTLDPEVFDEVGREGLGLAAAHMESLATLLAARGIRLTVAVYPWPDLVEAGERRPRHQQFWQEWARKNGAGFVDHFPDFVPDDEARRDAIRRDLFIPGDIHWNAAGHALVARGFLAQWRQPR